jgi:hypothetical protein
MSTSGCIRCATVHDSSSCRRPFNARVYFRDSVKHEPFWGPTAEPDPTEREGNAEPAVLEWIRVCLAKAGDTRSTFDRLKKYPAGDMYIYRAHGKRKCPYGQQHSSNNFSVLVRGRALLYCCSSSECCEIRPLKQIGMHTRYEAMLGGEVALISADDESVYRTLDKRFVDHWAFQRDMGGSHIAVSAFKCSRNGTKYSQPLQKWYNGCIYWEDLKSAMASQNKPHLAAAPSPLMTAIRKSGIALRLDRSFRISWIHSYRRSSPSRAL